MGNKPSQAADYPVTDDEIRQAPHNFYLVYGKPSIRYARNRVRGPLLYDVDVEYDDDGEVVEHTATLDLTSAVPRRQRFELLAPTQSATGAAVAPTTRQREGWALTFRVAANTPPQRVRVLMDVAFQYRTGHGIRLGAAESAVSGTATSLHSSTTIRRNTESSTSSSTTDSSGIDISNTGNGAAAAAPRCIFHTTDTASLITVVTDPQVVPRHLRPIAYESVLHAATTMATVERVSYAPLVIEVVVGEVVNPIRPPRRATATAQASVSDPSPSAAPQRIVQYTLLELPASPAAESERMACTVCKQLLQVGAEVYELEDVFDVEQTDVAPNPQAVPDEEEGMCAVCFTNPKDTTILPCRHMCLCSECATHVQMTNNRCPLCRCEIERLMTFNPAPAAVVSGAAITVDHRYVL